MSPPKNQLRSRKIQDHQARLEAALAEVEANVVELARRFGPETLKFLVSVMRGDAAALDVNVIPLGLRLQAADLVRKFCAIPTNVDLSVKGPPQIVYVGDRDVASLPLPAEVVDVSELREDRTRILRPIVDPEREAAADSPDDSES